jgi:hypothetical protein
LAPYGLRPCPRSGASQKAVDTALRAAGLGRVEFMLVTSSLGATEGNLHHLGAT